MKRVICCVFLFLAGCATPINVQSHFDPAEAAKMLTPGNNTIHGSALIRQNGGVVVTCAGQTVSLTPPTTYARERFRLLYGSEQGGYNPVFMGKRLKNTNSDAQYMQFTKQTRCDAQGYFTFHNLADGEYFISTMITWDGGRAYVTEGGGLAQLVKIAGGEIKEIILAP